MATLEGQTIAASYEQLLHVDRDGGGNTSSLVSVKDGDNGTTFCISLTDASTGKAVLAVDGSHANGTEIQIDNSATDGDAFLSFQLSGTSKFTMGVDDGDSDVFKIGTTAIGTGTMFVLDTNSKISLSNNDSGTSNTILGKSAGASLDAGSNYNVFIGENVSDASMNDATENVGIGYGALSALTTGDYNVVIGTSAGSTMQAAQSCTIIGRQACEGNLTTAANGTVAIGMQALTALTSGANNLCIGSLSGRAITTGGQNVFVGEDTGRDLVTGSGNVAIGTGAADAFEAVESYNIAIGTNSMGAWQEGNGNVDRNIAIGTEAFLGGNIGGGGVSALDNIAIGYNALDSGAISNVNMTGTVAIGSFALSLATGSNNIAIGYNAMQDVVEGARNIAIGRKAFGGDLDTTADASTNNTFIGYQCGGGNWTTAVSAGNVAIGNYSMDAVLTGANSNTVIGYNCATNLTNGDSNVIIGNTTAETIQTGLRNIIIGAGSNVDDEGRNDSIVIGYGMTSTAGDEVLRIGASSNYLTYGFDSGGGISITSDGRIKKDIRDSDLGLDFINELRPIKYRRKARRDWPEEFIAPNDPNIDKEPNPTEWDGFIAQDVKAAADKLGVEYSGWTEDSSNTRQELQYAMFVIPLVKAVQELSQQVEDLKAKIN